MVIGHFKAHFLTVFSFLAVLSAHAQFSGDDALNSRSVPGVEGAGLTPLSQGEAPRSVGDRFRVKDRVNNNLNTSINMADAEARQRELADALDASKAHNGKLRQLREPLTVTEFQRFLQDTTGQKISLYGYKLFESDVFPSLQNVPVPLDYVIGPGDEILLKVWGTIDADLRLPVDRNGQISLPRIGTFRIAGLKSSELEATLKSQIARNYTGFQLSATLGRLRSMQIFVVGQARQPGAYMVSSLSSLVSVLFESGGPASNGSMRKIELRRDNQLVATIDLYKFINQGDKASDARLLPGDTIVIQPAGPRIALTGAIESPSIYELSSTEEQLGEVLSYAGGVGALTTPHKILVERINTKLTKAQRSVEERALDAQGLQSSVRDGDVITLFKISPEFSNAVTLRGNVASPQRHAFRPGMRVSDLIPERDALIQSAYFTRKNLLVQYDARSRSAGERGDLLQSDARSRSAGERGDLLQSDARSRSAGERGDLLQSDARSRSAGERGDLLQSDARSRSAGESVRADLTNLLNEINWDYASIVRLDGSELRSQLIPFNLGQAIRDKNSEHNLELKAGDVVNIFSVKDIPVPIEKRSHYVRIYGEVMIPGIYKVQPNETLPQLVVRAGGISRNADVYGIVFTRESARQQQQTNLNQAIRRAESDMSSRSAVLTQNITDPAQAQAQVQAQAQALRSQLFRLQGLKASGRISLELKPDKLVLPDLKLEDEDQINIPHQSNFIGVYGSVMAETTFIHRSEASVSSYLDRAGLTLASEVDDTLIIRADGSVEGPAADRSWLAMSKGVLSKKLHPGDAIFVPEKVDRRSGYFQFIQGAKDWTAILYQFGLGVAALKTLSN